MKKLNTDTIADYVCSNWDDDFSKYAVYATNSLVKVFEEKIITDEDYNIVVPEKPTKEEMQYMIELCLSILDRDYLKENTEKEAYDFWAGTINCSPSLAISGLADTIASVFVANKELIDRMIGIDSAKALQILKDEYIYGTGLETLVLLQTPQNSKDIQEGLDKVYEANCA